MKMGKKVCVIALLAVLAAVTPLTAVAQLGPNTAVYTPDTALAGGVTDVTQLAVATATITTASFKVDVRQEVWRNSAGYLDFYYQVTNVVTPGKTGVIHRVTVGCFSFATIPAAGWVSTLAGSGFVAGTEDTHNVTRDAGPDGGAIVGFDMGTASLAVEPRETSQILFVQTERRNFTHVDASVGIINGIPGSNITDFYGVKCVPEPAMVQLSSLAGLGFLGLLRFRKRNKA